MATQIFGVVVIGSYGLELGIYEIAENNKLKRVDYLRHVISLGADTRQTGKISYELVEEMCKKLNEFSDVMKGYGVKNYQIYATTAVRTAQNRQIVLDQIRVLTGFDVVVLDNAEQRFLSYKAIAAKKKDFQKFISKGTLIADVSYGSLQLSLFDKERLITTQNIQLGLTRIMGTVDMLQSDRATETQIIKDMIDAELQSFKKMYLRVREVKNVIAIGESILFLARDIVSGKKNDRVTSDVFNAMCDKVTGMSSYQIEESFDVNEDYARILFPASILYRQIVELTGADTVWIPGTCLSDGVAANYAESIGCLKFTHNFNDDILTITRSIAKRYKCNIGHGKCMEPYALAIFDATKKLHGLGQRERLLLQIATILHDCGKFISFKEAGRCGYQIIMSTEIIGLSRAELKKVADIVRYNMEPFNYDKSDLTAAKLTAILRLADAMDRSHHKRLEDCRIRVKGDRLIISTSYVGDLSLEIIGVEDNADFFEEIYGIRPVIKQKKEALTYG